MSTSLYFLGLYNVVTNSLKVAANVSSDLFNAACNFLNGTSDEWYFFDHTGPIPASAYNIPYSSYRNRIRFTYNRYKNTLIQEQDGIQSDSLRFNFLSTQLIADGKAYTMDDWIKYLVISVADYDALSVRRLVDAWSVYHRIWPDDNAELHIIDSEGQSHTFHINDPVNDAWIALLPFEKEEELTEEEEEEKAEETEETEETEDDEEEEAAQPVEAESIIEPPSTPVLEATVTETPVEPTAETAIETVTVTLDSLANIDIVHLSGV